VSSGARQRKTIVGDHLPWLAAVLGTLLLHTLFFNSLGMLPPTPAASSIIKPHPKCVMLSPPASAQAWENELRAWCLLADPTLLSLPSETLGFSRFRTATRPMPRREIPSYSYSHDFMPVTIHTPPPLIGKQQALSLAIAANWPQPLPQIITQPVAATLPTGIIWRRRDGTLLEHALKLPDDAVNSAAATAELNGPSQVEISRRLNNTRVRLLKSSGNRALDQLLIENLTRQVGFFLNSPQRRQEPAAQLYFPDEETPQQFEVEWRLR